jgi:hypothetical protein
MASDAPINSWNDRSSMIQSIYKIRERYTRTKDPLPVMNYRQVRKAIRCIIIPSHAMVSPLPPVSPPPTGLPATPPDPTLVMVVEEDWRMVTGVITTPPVANNDIDGGVPQMGSGMYWDVGNTGAGGYAWFSINYFDNEGTQGGVELNLYGAPGNPSVPGGATGDGSWLTQPPGYTPVTPGVYYKQLHSNEVTTWTQRLSLSGGHITVSVVGTSPTIGSFNLGASCPTGVVSLAAYNPAKSVSSSGVSYGGPPETKVTSWVLTTVRYYNGTMIAVAQDNTQRTVI